MRDLNECKTEVFKRSEVRIKKRRKRKSAVLSLIVTLVVFSAVSFLCSPAVSTDSANFGNFENMAQKETAPFQALKITPIISTADCEAINIESEEKIEAVYSKINALFESANNEESSYYSSYESSSTNDEIKKPEGNEQTQFLLTFLGDETQKYTLEENKITNENTSETITITKEDFFEIEQMIS